MMEGMRYALLTGCYLHGDAGFTFAVRAMWLSVLMLGNSVNGMWVWCIRVTNGL